VWITGAHRFHRNGGVDSCRASKADTDAWTRARRPKSCKLAGSPHLIREITAKLIKQWSPEQISGWLKRQYPDDQCYHVSHKTIYKSLFIQTRGVLKKELIACLLTPISSRRPKKFSLKGTRIGKVPEAISIRERPLQWRIGLYLGTGKAI
jgi:IS30 family transposase